MLMRSKLGLKLNILLIFMQTALIEREIEVEINVSHEAKIFVDTAESKLPNSQ